MATEYSIQKMVSDGTLSTIALGIQYLQRNDIYIRIAGEETPQSGAPSGYTWSFLDNTTLKILPVVPNGVEVVVYRRTDVDAMYNIYSQNAQFDEATIDENNQQLLYIAQEYLEQGIPGAGVDIIEFIRDDGSFTYYRIKRTDGSYSDEFYVPSAGSITKVLARESLRRSYAEAGFKLVDGSFEIGGTVTTTADVLLHESTGIAYSWGGVLPKIVPAGSTQDSTGGISTSNWSPQDDIGVRGGFFYSTVHQSVPSGSSLPSEVNFGARDYDPASLWPGFGGAITIPAGVSRVRLTGGVLFDSGASSSYRELRFTLNGNHMRGTGQQSTTSIAGKGTYMNIVSGIIMVTPGDVFRMVAGHDDGVNCNLMAGSCWLQVEIIT